MAVAVQNVYGTSSVAGTLNGVVCAAGATKLVVAAMIRDITTADRVVTSVTYNGSAMTFVAAADNSGSTDNNRTEFWYMDSPPLITATVQVNFAGTVGFASIGAAVLTGAGTGTAEATNTDVGTGANPSVAVTATAGAIVIGGCCFENQDAGFATGDTVIVNTATTRRRVAVYRLSGAGGSEAIAFTNTATGKAMLVASFAQAGASPQTWTGSAATLTLSATSGTFTPGPVTWTGSAATLTLSATSGTFVPGGRTWVGSAATLTLSATSGSFTPGAVSWTGSAATLTLTAVSGGVRC